LSESDPPAGALRDAGLYRIGEVAEAVHVSTRTLRYYDQLGLVEPSSHSQGGSRRYSQGDLQRVFRVRELQAVMGFNLEEIRTILDAEARLAELQQEYRGGVSPARKQAIVVEVASLNATTQDKVAAKILILEEFLADLQAAAKRYRAFAAQNHIPLPESCTPQKVN
jgi:DNA-binding transcriptional MerR regulator